MPTTETADVPQTLDWNTGQAFESSGALLTGLNGGAPGYAPVDTLKLADVPTPVVPGGDELRDHWTTTTGTGSNDLTIVHLVQTRTPSSGLTAEQFHTSLQVFDPSSSVPSVHLALPQIDLEALVVETFFGTNSGTLVLATRADNFGRCENDCTVTVIDPGARAVLPSIKGSVVSAYDDRLVINQQSPAGKDCPQLAAFTASTMTPLWTLDPSAQEGRTKCRAAYQIGSSAESAQDAPLLAVELRSYSEPLQTVVIDSASGQLARAPFLFASSVAVDPISDYLLVNVSTEGGTNTIEIYEIGSWNLIYEVTKDQFYDLNLDLNQTSLIGGHLYAKTKDGNPVIDIVSKKTLSENYTTRPVRVVGQRWAFTDQYSSADGIDLAYPLSNGVYSGPWF